MDENWIIFLFTMSKLYKNGVDLFLVVFAVFLIKSELAVVMTVSDDGSD